MEQLQYNPEFFRQEFRPAQAPDMNVGSAANQQIANQSAQNAINNLQQDAKTAAANDAKAAEGQKALAKFSQTLTKVVEKQAYKQADDDFAEGLLYAYENPGTLKPEEPDASGEQTLDAAGNAIAANPQNADIVVPAVRGSRFFQMGAAQGRAANAINTQYTPFMEQAVATANPQTPQELQVVLADARKQFFSQASIDRSALSNNFLLDKVFPQMGQQDARLHKKFSNQILGEQSFNAQTEAFTTFENSGDVNTLLKSVAITTDGQGNPLGYSGAWNQLTNHLSEGITNGKYSETDIVSMESQPIPGDPKGRTYGELHGNKFRTARLAARKAKVSRYNLEQSERSAIASQQEQALLDSFLDPNDADGFTSEQRDAAADQLEAANPGFVATKLRRLESVDDKTRKKQDEEIQELMGLGLLTPERLSKYDVKLQAKYRSQAINQGKMASGNGNFKAQIDVLKQAARAGTTKQPINVAPGAGVKPSIGLWEIKLTQMFQQKVAQGIDPAEALNEVLLYHEQNAQITVDGYKNVMPSANSVQTAQIKRDYRQYELNEGIKNPETINTPFGFFDEAQLTDIIKGYGKPGWSPGAEAMYIGDKLQMDPIAVINAQLEASGMGDKKLELSDAGKVYTNELTPNQRAALANIGNIEVSSRVMGSFNKFRPELVPGNYGTMIEQTAARFGLEPGALAALADRESSFNPNAVSYNGSSFGMMQLNKAAHPGFFQQNDWKDPQANLNYGAEYFAGLVKRYNGDYVAAAMAYNGGPGNYDAYVNGQLPDGAIKTEMINHGRKFQQSLYKYGGGTASLNQPQSLRGNAFKLTSSTQKYLGMDTSAGPDNGVNACVYAVNKVMASAGMEIPWGNSVYVPEVKRILDGHARRVDGPVPGAIAIMQDTGKPPYPHIGIVQADGSIISNSSSRAKFDWVDTPQAYEQKYGRPNLYYVM